VRAVTVWRSPLRMSVRRTSLPTGR
jgi:hypothetical protein